MKEGTAFEDRGCRSQQSAKGPCPCLHPALRV